MGLLAKIFPIQGLYMACRTDGEDCHKKCRFRGEIRIFYSVKKSRDLYLLQSNSGNKVLYFNNSDVKVPEGAKPGFICLCGGEDIKEILVAPLLP